MIPRLVNGICTYHRQWMSGDIRGWRSRDNKRHSSGDYRNPPPPDEHAGLRKWVGQHMTGDPVFLDPPEYSVVGLAFVHRIHVLGSAVRCLSCGPTHVHLLYDSVANDAKAELGKAKQYASLKLATRPGRIWARDCSVDVIDDPEHASNLWTYILDHARKEGAWVWRNDRDAVPTRDDIKRHLDDCLKPMPGSRV